MRGETARQCYIRRHGELLKERQASWDGLYKQLEQYIAPNLFRFDQSKTNRGDRKDASIVNNTARMAHRVQTSGMMSGCVSQSRKWFRLTLSVERYLETINAGAEVGSIRPWLAEVEARMYEVFARSNLYPALCEVFASLGVPGTAVMFVEEDEEDVLRCYPLVCGEYVLASSDRMSVDTLYREFLMPAGGLVKKFGLENCSQRIKELVERGNEDRMVKVLHVVEPNTDWDERYVDNKHMPFRSVWLESDNPGDKNAAFLREGGYRVKPFLAPRWEIVGSDTYGSNSPGMVALGDAKALQLYEIEEATAIAKIVSPPMQGPTSLYERSISLVAGDFNGIPNMSPGARLEPAVTIDARALPALIQAKQEHERRIRAAFFSDLMLLVANEERSNVTAEEIRAKKQEQMLQLGPVVERVNDELLDPLIDRAFDIMDQMGLLPPPPPEIQGQPIKVEYLSIMSAAQKLLGTTAVERLTSFVASLAQFSPSALQKLNWDKIVEDYAEMLGVAPDELLSNEAVAQLRAQQAAAQQQAAMQQQQLAASQQARNLAGASLENDNALTRMLGSMGPQAPGGGAP